MQNHFILNKKSVVPESKIRVVVAFCCCFCCCCFCLVGWFGFL
ncbi:hypothetical protein Nmel_008446 [Mimus melanotis]